VVTLEADQNMPDDVSFPSGVELLAAIYISQTEYRAVVNSCCSMWQRTSVCLFPLCL